jgi:acyl-CoA hydrolase
MAKTKQVGREHNLFLERVLDLEEYMEKEKTIEEILSLIPNGSDIIIPLGNGEPDAILSELDENLDLFTNLKFHQILELKDRKYMHKGNANIEYHSYFMNGFARSAYRDRKIELVPNHFHQVPKIIENRVKKPIMVCQTSPIDENGYFSLGTGADYASYFIGKIPFIIQVNEYMPRTYGTNKIHISQILGYVKHDMPLFELPSVQVNEIDITIAQYIAEHIDNGSTMQVGIGGIPNAVISLLKNHKDLGIHTEMLTDGIAELYQNGVITGAQKKTHSEKIVATFVLGSKKLYDFVDRNPVIEMLPVEYVNNPITIAKEDNIVAINATTEVDFYGQCASETIAGKYYSSSGGQADFGTGVQLSENGKGFICLYSTAKNDEISRIRPTLAPASVVTTSKNDVDYVVTEYGIAQLRNKSISERTKSLISIAHPKFRDELLFDAKKMGFIIY